MEGKIKIGQIGIGHNHGTGKMLSVRKLSDLFEVVGYCEPDEEWVKKRGDLPCYRDLPRMSEEELLSKCDAILVEKDVWNLTKTARRCIDAGKHIHMDKPANGTNEEFFALLDEAERKHLTVQLGYMYRYNPAVQKTLKLARDGSLGEITNVQAQMSTFHDVDYKKWLTRFSGGIMFILGSHLIDLAVLFLGKPEKVTSFFKHTCLDGVDFPDNNLAVLEYPKALAEIVVSSVEVNGWGRRQLVVAGTKGTVEIEPLENTCHMTYADLNVSHNPYEDFHVEIPVEDLAKDCRYDEMMRDFAAMVRGERENPFGFAHEKAVHETVNAVCGIN